MRHATLCFIRDGDRLLLIEKKRGVGAGLFNGPGGKVEEAEAPHRAAAREVQEEIGVTVPADDLEKRGELRFVFGDAPFMHVHVFEADGFDGEPMETEEAVPHWFHVDELPFDDMWPDDKHWVPVMLDGDQFRGTFWFDADGDEVLDFTLERARVGDRTSWIGHR